VGVSRCVQGRPRAEARWWHKQASRSSRKHSVGAVLLCPELRCAVDQAHAVPRDDLTIHLWNRLGARSYSGSLSGSRIHQHYLVSQQLAQMRSIHLRVHNFFGKGRRSQPKVGRRRGTAFRAIQGVSNVDFSGIQQAPMNAITTGPRPIPRRSSFEASKAYLKKARLA